MGPVRAVQAAFEQDNDEFIVSYIFLRRAIGVIGIALPFVLALGNRYIYLSHVYPSSISHYYYTDMRTYFTGSLCAIGVFLLAYRGKKKIDSILGTCAFFFALGVAFFPTEQECGVPPIAPPPLGCPVTAMQITVGDFHVFFAAALFITLGLFSLFLFTRNDKPGRPSEKKKTRNMIYRACGVIILVSIVLIAVAWGVKVPVEWHSTYWLEAVAIVAFGVSWLIKGETLFADRQDKESEPQKRSVEQSE